MNSRKYQTEVSWTRPNCDCFEVDLEHCFVTSEPASTFLELRILQIGSEKRDLHFLFMAPGPQISKGVVKIANSFLEGFYSSFVDLGH